MAPDPTSCSVLKSAPEPASSSDALKSAPEPEAEHEPRTPEELATDWMRKAVIPKKGAYEEYWKALAASVDKW